MGRTVAEYVHREVNGNATGPPNNNNAGTSMRYRDQIASVTSSISQGQPLPPGGAAGQLQQHSVQQSPHLVRPPIFTRLLSIVRSFCGVLAFEFGNVCGYCQFQMFLLGLVQGKQIRLRAKKKKKKWEKREKIISTNLGQN